MSVKAEDKGQHTLSLGKNTDTDSLKILIDLEIFLCTSDKISIEYLSNWSNVSRRENILDPIYPNILGKR